MSGPGQDSEPEAKVLHTKRLYRAVVESVHKLDLIIGNKSSYREVFKPENISLRNKLRELCVKLMFLHPVDYGRKAEELLWRKVYYEVIQLIKTNKKHVHSRSALECAYRTHLIAGVGFYQHLLLYIQSHYQLELQDCIDWTHVTDPLIGRKKAVSATAKEMDWAQMACHRCLVYLGDLARYQNELAGVEAELLAERFYHQALSVTPHVGMPFNQLGTLAGSKYYNVEATYYYLRCIQSEMPFEGAYGNLKRLYDKAAKMYHQVKKQEMKKLSPTKQRSKDVKRLLVSFMYLQSLLQPKNSMLESELTSLCQSVLEDFNLVLFYLPSASHSSSGCEEEEDHESRYSFVPDVLVFRMVVTCLMVVHNLKRAGSKQYSAAIAFTLAMFSHLVNHVNIHLQAELEEGESGVPVLHTDDLEVKDGVTLTPEEGTLQNGTAEEEEEEEEEERSGKGADGQKKPSNSTDKTKKSGKKKYSRLSRLRRRRYDGKEDESDLSEGFESEGERGGRVGGRRVGAAVVSTAITRAKHKGADWDSGSEKSEEDYEEEEAETAFDVETDSDMNSQESRSDLEDIEDEKTEIAGVPDSLDSADSKPLEKAEPSPAVNGPTPSSSSSDSSIASNLQAMSSQLFQTKRCFRLAPTFSNVLLRPCSAPQASGGGSSPQPTALDQTPLASSNPSATPQTASDNDGGSDSEGSVESNQSCRNEKTLLERLEILTNQGLLPAVKVFLDWLRANTDIIVMCAQSSQSLWNRLSVLLNLLPDSRKILEAEVPLCEEVSELLSACERPDLQQTLLLPEDVALRHLPALRAAHKRLDMERESPTLSTLQESVVRLSCIRSFGHFLTRLQGNVLHFNPEAGIFTSISQSEQENLLQQARAQFRMAEEEARRNRLMRDMAQLRLQLEVSQLEGSLQQPKAQSSMSPYLVPDTTALCQHLGLIRQLAGSGRFIIIIPRTVIDGLDFLKKENAGARDGIRFLESEFRKGNRYIRCQRESGKSFERHKLKRQDSDAWHLYKMVDSCRQLTVSQGSGEEDTAGMVTILTGFHIEDVTTLSPRMQAALQAVSVAGIELKNILEFYKQWKEMG
ncbi:nonsense-mediated mRNA decay factor SMG5-like [Acipenser ruthenus]|uniref:nonsense-mediated mRNA decay factor SMG5-like n=1 Tax=Acipenser ruthenus TaxID=7906 RepID=UPI0027405784|nr:nonsense-mediated mRNA decay factor SMG5-like [Acipenser ruthenus]